MHFSKTFFKSSNVGYHSKPPGSGVPVLGANDGSKASKSIVIYTLPETFSKTSSIQFGFLAISCAQKHCPFGTYCISSASQERIPTCTKFNFCEASKTAQA